MSLYQYPKSTEVNRPISKTTFYQKGKADSKMERLFIEQIENIQWANKLSAQTIHLEANDDFKEIQIFHIQSRVEEIDHRILHYIDKLIPSPIVFEIHYQAHIQVIATYKRLNPQNHLQNIIGEYYQSQWFEQDNRQPLPLFIYLADLYAHIISELLPNRIEQKIPIQEKLALNHKIEKLKKEIKQLTQRLNNTKQLNRKVEINLQLKQLKSQLALYQSE